MAFDLISKLGNLIRFLPTGTVFVFQFLNPVFTDYGNCKSLNKYLSSILIALCGFSCCFGCFTDSYKGSDGKTHYGIATFKGLWPSVESDSVNLSRYKIRFSDFIHAFFSLIVFAVLVLVEPNTVQCFYPSLATSSKALLYLILLPPITFIVSLAFMFFPNKRHGIGYPSSQQSSNKTNLLLP
ncbi:protein DMP2-like [Durio zibethinus]|uniref:Protein DMP2-like n=1 Tax=Durio zibethinus TaxID=66656 RepID=A0A6P6A8D9_DURZI|nr:protein DMP2-like [Durio zibethinus]